MIKIFLLLGALGLGAVIAPRYIEGVTTPCQAYGVASVRDEWTKEREVTGPYDPIIVYNIAKAWGITTGNYIQTRHSSSECVVWYWQRKIGIGDSFVSFKE